MISNKKTLAVVGMGYVGLPLAINLSKKNNIIGFDININRIVDLKRGFDLTKEVSKKELLSSKNLKFSSNLIDLKKCSAYIITVPTPVHQNHFVVISHL